MLKRAKFYSLLAVIVASTVIQLFGSQITLAQTTPPAGSPDLSVHIDAGLEKDVTTKGWRAGMLSCLRAQFYAQGLNQFIGYQDLVAGNWFPNNEDKNVGYLVEPTDGRYECNEKGFVTGFVKYFGWSTPFEAACALGFMPSKGAPDVNKCLSSNQPNSKGTVDTDYIYYGDGNENSIISFSAAAIDKQITYTTGPTDLSGPELYVLYMRTFQMACGPTNPTTVAPGIDNRANSTSVKLVDIQNGTPTPTTVYYTVPSLGASKHTRRTTVDGQGHNEEKTCQEIATAINDNAQAYIDWLTKNPNSQTAKDPTANKGSGGDAKSNCQVTGIGWIVCPVINFIARIADSAYYVLDLYFLKLPPVNVNTSDATNGLYHAWSIMRDIANVVFVIVFLFLVFSQITGMGISNYGIKRMIPKLIVAAILVNTSYFICAFFVDVSNIVGSSLKAFLDTLGGQILPAATTTANGSYWSDEAHNLLADAVIGGALLGTGAIAAMAGFAVFIPLIFIILPIVIAVLVAVLVRQALAVLLIFISPIAFVAMLLPNTEDLYKKWKEAFKVVLLFYPIVALVFGASALASAILMAAAPAAGDKGAQMIQGIAAGAIRIVPLIAIPAIMKLVTGVLGRFSGIVNDPGKGFFDNRRNIAAENGKIRAAGRIGKIGNWVNPTKLDADGKPIPDTDPRHKRLFGGSGSLRRRAVGALTAYGVSDRERYRKDRLDAAEKTLEGTYLGSERGQDARNTAKNAQISLQNAQINTDTLRISSAEGMALQQETTNAEKRQKLAQDEAMTAAITALPAALLGQAETAETKRQTADTSAKATGLSMMATTSEGQGALKSAEAAGVSKKTAEDKAKSIGLSYLSQTGPGRAMLADAKNAELARSGLENDIKTAGLDGANADLKVRAATSAVNASTAENRDKQLYEETVAGTPPLGVNGATAASALAARESAHETELRKHTAENLAEAAVTRTTPGSLAAQAKDAEFANKAAKDNLDRLGIAGASPVAAAAAKTAELEKQTADNYLQVHAAPLVSRGTRVAAYESGLEKENIENRKEAAAIRVADNDIKVQSQASAELLSTANSEVKQGYEEAVAGTPPSGVNSGSVAQAQAARRSSNVNSARTDSAKRVSEDTFSERVLNDSALATKMGGIDPNGADRQEARAAASKMRAHKEIVDNKISLLEYNGTPSATLYRDATNHTLPVEDQEANAILLTRNGGDNQIDDFYDYIVTMPPSDLRTTLQQQFAANVGSRRSQAIGETDMDNLRAGKQSTTIREGWRNRAAKLSGAGAASMSQDRLQSLLKSYSDYFAGSMGNPTLETNMKAFSNSIKDFKSSPNFKNLKPPKEILDKIDAIEALIDSNIP